MIWKVLLFAVLAILLVYTFFGFGNDTFGVINKDIRDELGPWIRDNINSRWLEDRPDAKEIVMQKFSFSNPVYDKETKRHTSNLTVKGYYTMAENGQQIKFKTTRLLEINKIAYPMKFKLLD